MTRTLQWRLWTVGVIAWVVVVLLFWPAALSFADSVGYLGQARLLLDGQLRPATDSVGFWVLGPAGEIAKYPLFLPLLLAPLFAIWPPLVFAVGLLSVVGLSALTARILDEWREQPIWGLLILASPAHALLARTIVPDTLLCLCAVGAWWALRRGSRGVALWFALTVLAKPTGIVIAAALLAGEAIARRPGRPRGLPAGFLPASLGLVAGCAIAAAFNLMTTGSLWYGYRWAHVGRVEFAWSHVVENGPVHLQSLFVMPPLLALGGYFLWRRRALGPLFATVALVGFMSAYWFVDSGRGLLDGLALSQRLILPAVSFLLLGYADMLGGCAKRIRMLPVAAVLLLLLAPAVALALGLEHSNWQRPMRQARQAALDRASTHEGSTIGMNSPAFKAGMLTRHEIVWFEAARRQPCVVLCNTASGSYREPMEIRCEFEGYRTVEQIATYRILEGVACSPSDASP